MGEDGTREGARSLHEDPRDHLLDRVLDGRYIVMERIGRGGMATVYHGQHVLIERQVAIKVLSPKTSGVSNIKKRFYREARVVNRIQHPNVLDVIDLGETEEHLLYLVMDYLTGGSVFDHLEKRNFTPLETVEVLEQVCRGLGRAHDLGIIHRDLSPSNIFVCDEGGGSKSIKILDFGIAFIKNETRLSMPGTVLGTPHYMAPEYAMGKEVVPASDLYSLGAVAYEMLCGDPPFDEDDYAAVIVKHVKEQPQALHEREPSVPDELHDVVMRCLSKKPEERYANAYELHEVLESLLRDLSSSTRRSLSPGSVPPGASGAEALPSSPPPTPVGYDMLRSYVEKARAGLDPQTTPYRATQVKQMLEEIEGYDASIAETEGKLCDLDARVLATGERFGRARATLEEERSRIGNDLAVLEGDLAGVVARLEKKSATIMDLRRRVMGTEHVLGLDDGSDAAMTDALAEAYVQTADLLRDWREASSSKKELEERIEERQGELRDIAFQIEQLGTNQEESLARLEGTARGLRMVLGEKELERNRLCSGLVEKGPTLIKAP
ncbi:MAG: protein kinase [Deltaproteobacteria bacterium]|nr:protein kinase [Deltaproteobacteria bacterium]